MKLGPYEILGELGRGASGTVFRARAPDGRSVAIKVLHRLDPAARARFDRERRLLGSLADGFVPLIDAGNAPQGPWVALPLLEGGSLRDRLRHGQLPIDEALALGIRLARVVATAHAQGIIHRDLKPENVLFDRAGQAFVADLGLAKHFDALAPGASASVILSKSSELRGTPAYMAPEQIRDSKHVGPPADVFALGVILYECLAGEPPFGGVNLLELLDHLESGKFRAPRARRADVPPAIDAVVRRALARDPAERYPDAAALALALESPSRAPRRRAPRGAALGGALATAGLLVLVFRGGAAPGIRPPPPPPPRPPAVATTDAEARAFARRIEDLLGTEHHDEALAEANRAIARDPSFALGFALRGRIKMIQDDLKGGLADEDRAVALAPRDALCHSWRAWVLVQTGDLPGARDEHERAVALDPRSALALANRAGTRANTADLEGALADANRAIELDPQLTRAWTVHTFVSMRLQQYDKALADAVRVTELEPRWTGGWIDRGGAHVRLGDPPAAIAELDQAIALGTREPNAWIHRCDARIRLNDFDAALADADHATELAPRSPQAWHARARALLALKRWEESLVAFDRSLELDGANPATHENRGRVLMVLNQPARALADFEFTAKLGDSGELHALIGVAHQMLGEADKAFAEYARALELDPKCIMALARRAQLETERGEDAAAIRDIEECLRLAPDAPEAPAWRAGIEDLRKKKP